MAKEIISRRNTKSTGLVSCMVFSSSGCAMVHRVLIFLEGSYAHHCITNATLTFFWFSSFWAQSSSFSNFTSLCAALWFSWSSLFNSTPFACASCGRVSKTRLLKGYLRPAGQCAQFQRGTCSPCPAVQWPQADAVLSSIKCCDCRWK
jgi:ABC-type phosphate transport system permease subunit